MELEIYRGLGLIATLEEKTRALSRKGRFLWPFTSVVRRLRGLTEGNTVIMGRKTAEIFATLLADHCHIVVLSKRLLSSPGHVVCRDFYEAIAFASNKWRETKMFVIGGEGPFREALPHAERLYLTLVRDPFINGDRFFPKIDEREYDTAESVEGGEGEHSFRTVTLERKIKTAA